MDNSMQNMLDVYLYETNTMTEQLDGILLEAEKDGVFSTDDINEIFRIMHTIKGSSAMMQFDSLSTVAHRVEDLFYFLRENGGHNELGHDLFNLLFKASDFIKMQIENIENNEPISEDIADLTNSISEMLASLKGENSPSAEGGGEKDKEEPAEKETVPTPADMAHPYGIRVFFDEDSGMENLRAFMLVNQIKDVCKEFTYIPENIENDTETSAEIVEHGFLLWFSSREEMEKGVSMVKGAMNIRTYEVLEPADGASAVSIGKDETTPETGAKAEAPKAEHSRGGRASKESPVSTSHLSTGKQNLISVNLSKLDNLMAIVGEIVITESMVTSNPDLQGLRLDNFMKSARQLRKLTDEMQDTVMSIRMVPISGIFQKMNRIVRDMSQSLDKPAKLVTVGADTEVDKTIVDNLGDPIMHMVRNSMDHGLETREERIRAGKNPEGTVTLSAKHTGSEILITIEDDGAGVNTEKVLQKARENGLLTKPESEYTQKEILQMLFVPGFSTNDNVTEYSGRGVGMDVVKKNLEKVGGIISMTSEEGVGSCTTLKIPLTLAIVDGMEVSVGDSIFTIPINNIRQSFKVTEADIVYDSARGEMIRRMDDFYPILRVNEIFSLPSKAQSIEDGIVIWVEVSDKSYCLFVDELLGEQQVVVKPLPPYLNSYNILDAGIGGCTILGDGSISIILDVLNFYRAASGLW